MGGGYLFYKNAMACVIKMMYVEGKIKIILLMLGSLVGAVLVGGVNNVTALQWIRILQHPEMRVVCYFT